MKFYSSMIFAIVMVVGLWTITGHSASADVPSDQLIVSVTPTQVSTSVGTSFEVTITLDNMAEEATPELGLHIDITDPRESGSVDPEDWAPSLTHSIAPIGPGEQVMQSWTLAPIQGGDFVLYAVALDMNAGVEPSTLAVSNGVPIHVEEKRSFNPQGVLPLAIAMPAMLGLALVWRHRRLRLK